ncbi:MAG: putative DNA binding domain-containing protein [Pseudomonadales bacterium]|jgi:ATP-dependent DNA helicase RecG|nr:putative DNA binding domain-containing protein [Pseudomonadales bacterium]
MITLINDLLEIPEETQTIEFKRLDGEKVVSKILKTVVAFANTDGGSIVLGIDDPEKTKLKGLERIYGIEENKDLYDEIIRKVQKIAPPLVVTPFKISVKEKHKTVVILKIPKATTGFHAVDDQVFMRLNKSNRRLSPTEIIKMSYAKGFERADNELVEVDFELLTTSHFDEWKTSRGLVGNIREILLRTGLAKKKSGKAFPTRTAVLLFADYPTDLMETKCAVKVMQYVGRIETYQETPNMIGVPRILSGPLVQLIHGTHDYVLTLLRSGVELHSGFITKYQIPERAVMEAITNAVIHRDYFMKRDIEIKIFEDRVEIISPGLLPYNITAQNIGYVRADGYRNDLLVKHMREFPIPPNFDQNEGVVAMRNEMVAQGLYPPMFITYPYLSDSVRVVLFNEHISTEWEKVKSYLHDNRYITNQIGREITGVVQKDKMYKLFKKWTDQGFLLKINPTGSKKDVKYKLSAKSDFED